MRDRPQGSVMRSAVPGHALLSTVLLAAVAGCANRPAPLYQWESFPRQQYSALLHDAVGPEEQIRTLEAQAEKARGAHAALPPGFRAHLGLLYLTAGNPQRSRELWLAEKAAFPESAHFMDRLLARLDAPPAATTAPAAAVRTVPNPA